MQFTNFEEFLGIRLDSGILEQWSNELELEELLAEIEDEIEEDEE
jgi:nicotinic acid phosphoribosyltransferase